MSVMTKLPRLTERQQFHIEVLAQAPSVQHEYVLDMHASTSRVLLRHKLIGFDEETSRFFLTEAGYEAARRYHP